MRYWYLPVILTAGLFLNCSNSPENSGTLPSSNKTETESSYTSAFSIGPGNATVRDIIKLKQGKIIQKVEWYVNGTQDESSQGTTFSPGNLKKGDTVYALVTSGRNEIKTNEIVMRNTAPVITKAVLSPPAPRVSDRISVDLNGLDADHDTISYTYKWYVNNQHKSDEDYLNAELKRGDIISVEITPFDQESKGNTLRLEGAIVNSPPVVTENTPVFNNMKYTCTFTATDPDGDALTFELREGPEGMSIDPGNGTLTWNVEPQDIGTHEVKVMVSDRNGASILVPITATISLQDTPS